MGTTITETRPISELVRPSGVRLSDVVRFVADAYLIGADELAANFEIDRAAVPGLARLAGLDSDGDDYTIGSESPDDALAALDDPDRYVGPAEIAAALPESEPESEPEPKSEPTGVADLRADGVSSYLAAYRGSEVGRAFEAYLRSGRSYAAGPASGNADEYADRLPDRANARAILIRAASEDVELVYGPFVLGLDVSDVRSVLALYYESSTDAKYRSYRGILKALAAFGWLDVKAGSARAKLRFGLPTGVRSRFVELGYISDPSVSL